MRENKFRVWCKNKKEWEKDMCFINQNDGLLQINKKYSTLIPCSNKNHIVEFYSGLNDHHGKFIFAGDILQCQHIETKDIEIVAVKDSPGQFSVYDPNCCDKCKKGDGCISYLSDWVYFPTQWSVIKIGNIHENPEIVTGYKRGGK